MALLTGDICKTGRAKNLRNKYDYLVGMVCGGKIILVIFTRIKYNKLNMYEYLFLDLLLIFDSERTIQ